MNYKKILTPEVERIITDSIKAAEYEWNEDVCS